MATNVITSTPVKRFGTRIMDFRWPTKHIHLFVFSLSSDIGRDSVLIISEFAEYTIVWGFFLAFKTSFLSFSHLNQISPAKANVSVNVATLMSRAQIVTQSSRSGGLDLP